MNIDERYPLRWPANWKRTPAHQRRAAAFSKRRTVAGTDYAYTQKTRLVPQITEWIARRIIEAEAVMSVEGAVAPA